MRCSKLSQTGRSPNPANFTMGEDLLGRSEDPQALNLHLAPKAKYLETSPLTFRGKKTIEAGAEVEVQDSTNLEVGEDLPLGEGEDPPTKNLTGRGTIRSGMTTSHLALELIETSRDGRKIPGQSREMLIDHKEMMPLDPREIITGNQIGPKKERATTLLDMTAGKGQEVPALEDIGEETTAPDMTMKAQEAGEEEITALKTMAAEDTLAMTDEKTAQGP